MERFVEMVETVRRITAAVLLCAAAAIGCLAQNLPQRGLHWDRVLMDGSRSARAENVSRGAASKVAATVESVQPEMADLKKVIACSDIQMDKAYPESLLSNWYADLMLVQGAKILGAPVDVCVGNFGGIRVDMPKGDVILDDIRSMFPFKNEIAFLKMRGDKLMQLFVQMARTNFQVLGGVRIEVMDKQIESVKIGGEVLDPQRLYTVISNTFLLHGGDGLFLADLAEQVDIRQQEIFETVMDYINDCTAAGKHLASELDGRIVIRHAHNVGKLVKPQPRYPGFSPEFTRGAASAAHRLNILHTNDTHSHIEAIRTGNHAGHAGVVERACFVDSVRNADKARGVLLVDAGDFEQGTPYFSLFRGKVEIQTMNQMGYDAATLGNHEFDNGIEDLAMRLKWARFKVVLTNYVFDHSGLGKTVKPYAIFRRGGYKIGVLGVLTDVRSVVDADVAQKLTYLDPTEPLNKWAEYLKKNKKCDLVIVLSHLGLTGGHTGEVGDIQVAATLRNVDAIIGGHSHTDLEAPCVLKDADGQDIVIVTDSCWGIYMAEMKIN